MYGEYPKLKLDEPDFIPTEPGTPQPNPIITRNPVIIETAAKKSKGTKLIAEHDGQTFTRTTNRNDDNMYTNVVIGYMKKTCCNYKEGEGWKALTWASSPRLANKAARQYERYYELLIITCRRV